MTARETSQEPAHGPIGAALARALSEVTPGAEDAACVALAQGYAQCLDLGVVDLEKAGPQLLAVLVQLRMTPASRLAVTKGGTSDGAGSALDQLKERRARLRNAKVVDAAPA